ncbi:peptide deformylase [Candidatus Jorgensenbacteria bacterium RIFCSPLOWO2_01_FULL_45_25b]|uniref:Peptide deformylase n=1 Tax=Candidatus Jorgensenbacteria bacterium RIFCSPLOWO2_01_FULL_45_25b TaxID=1798471 RepID=A0A1F6C0F8_9BACT|nr:MAG: peptide deformylase [Candidatus Jorgensenbacteria bacterium RIFCSPLOWO2_01_FULL_45_25b]
MQILTIDNKKSEKHLRMRVASTNLSAEKPSELRKLVSDMRKAMREARGVGLSANQVGVQKRLFIAQVPQKDGKRTFYSFINPVIKKTSKETVVMEEGCLSIPGVYGDVERFYSLTLEGYTVYGKKTKIRAFGLLAHVFQHEIDHLDGVLFIDKATNLHQVKFDEGVSNS